MKVLQILPELNSGGVERGTLEISEYLVSQGYESLVVSNGGRLVSELEKRGARHITLPVHRKSLLSLLQVKPLRRILTREQPDILHIRSRVPGWIAWLAWRKLDPASRPALVTTVHGFYSVNAYSAIMTRGARVIAVSNAIRDYIRANYRKVPSDVIRVIQRGVAPKEFPHGYQPSSEWLAKWHNEYPRLVGQKILTLPGRLTRLKGHEDFFQLMATLQQNRTPVHGLIVGEAHAGKQEYFAELKARVARLGLNDCITFTGHRADVRDILAVSAAVFSLSVQPESFGRTTLEALALGRSVIGYDHGGVGELLRELFPAGCVPLGNIVALVHTTQNILATQPTPALIQEPFTLEAMCRNTVATYRELLHPA